MNQTYNVTLNWSQLWEICNLLNEEASKLTHSISEAEEERFYDCAQTFKSRLDAIMDALNALPGL